MGEKKKRGCLRYCRRALHFAAWLRGLGDDRLPFFPTFPAAGAAGVCPRSDPDRWVFARLARDGIRPAMMESIKADTSVSLAICVVTAAKVRSVSGFSLAVSLS